MKNISVSIILFIALSMYGCNQRPDITEKVIIEKLNEWLNMNLNKREPLENLEFAKSPLTKSEAEVVANLLLADKQTKVLMDYEAQWEDRILSYNGLLMPFYYNTFGDAPLNGRSLFISLHGGGGTMAAINDQQYNNQKHLYDATMDSLEGIYLAPRAPTNTWDLWHQDHVDDLLNIIIQMAVIKLEVNPNKVYLLGYSAGGDGVYQLAPRMADRFAAASMMAGHPNDASPLNLRNTPFSIHVGALDSAFNRNTVAQEWHEKLNKLQLGDPQAYIHDVQIHEGLGHWMELKDAIALPWIKNYERNPIPEKVVWKLDRKQTNSFYWLGIPENGNKEDAKILVEYDTNLNEINIIENTNDTIQLLINDQMLDLDKPINIKYQGLSIGKDIYKRSIINIYQNMKFKADPMLSFPCVISVINNEKVLK